MENINNQSEETTEINIETEEGVVKTNESAVDNGASENSDTSKTANEENVNDVEFTDTPKDETPKTKEEIKQDNSENARRRREAEHQAELRKTRYEAIKEAVDGVNPYTQEKIETDVDVEQYLEMKEIAKNGGDPLKDYSKFVKDKRNEELAKEQENVKSEEYVQNDYKDFVSKHPDVDIEKLVDQPEFRKFAEPLIGKLPMAQIYESYNNLLSVTEKKNKEAIARQVANAKATPGSLTTPSVSENEFYTVEELKNMSQEEVHKNYDKVVKSMAHHKI